MSVIVKYSYDLVYKAITNKIDNSIYLRLYYKFKLPGIINLYLS